MIIARAPLRISFVGGGTDLPDFYSRSPGRVISTTIDKYVYVSINPAPLAKKVTARYSAFETVDHARDLKNDRMRAALLALGLEKNIDMSVFSDMAVGAGLGSSSSFSVALVKGLHALLGKKLEGQEAAELACELEINTLKEPIGKQDQYASALGGFNVFNFNSDNTVIVEPVHLDYQKKLDFRSHLILFFTGITHLASNVLREQVQNTDKNFQVLKSMADSVLEFRDRLLVGDFTGLGRMLAHAWQKKKSLASSISKDAIDKLYEAGVNSGAWGGKLLGAGGGGCLLFLTPPGKKPVIRRVLVDLANQLGLSDFQEIPFKFVQSGAEIIINQNFFSPRSGKDFSNFS